MQIAGLQKLSLLDFPDTPSCIVFTLGCNLACPFCHNADLVTPCKLIANEKINRPLISESEVLEFLNKRKAMLEGVCISGGEPLLQADLADFIIKVRHLGYKVKLDTNGCFPTKLKNLIDEGLLDYIAMDIKNSEQNYSLTAGANVSYENIKQSAKIIVESAVDYEFRTTVVKEFHTLQDIEDIGKQFKGARRFYLQNFADSGNIIQDGLTSFSDNEMQSMLSVIQKYIPDAKVR